MSEKEAWDKIVEQLAVADPVTWGRHWSFNYRNDPKRLAFVLARYKFAAKMGPARGSVLELGCGEGIGATILAEERASYTGVDLDLEAIETANKTLIDDRFNFMYDDFMGKTYGAFELVASLDVCEHIYPEHEAKYFKTLWQNVSDDGVLIVGTPNITAAPYASEASNRGHVNLFSQERLKETLEGYFHNVFPFGMNDETLHTGFASMSHYIFCMACNKKEDIE